MYKSLEHQSFKILSADLTNFIWDLNKYYFLEKYIPIIFVLHIHLYP